MWNIHIKYKGLTNNVIIDQISEIFKSSSDIQSETSNSTGLMKQKKKI